LEGQASELNHGNEIVEEEASTHEMAEDDIELEEDLPEHEPEVEIKEEEDSLTTITLTPLERKFRKSKSNIAPASELSHFGTYYVLHVTIPLQPLAPAQIALRCRQARPSRRCTFAITAARNIRRART